MPPEKVSEKETKDVIRRCNKKGVCPANNTTCTFLTMFGCSLKYPKLYYKNIRQIGIGYSCGSYEEKPKIYC